MMSFGIFIFQLYLFVALALVLHANSPRIGIMPVFLFGAGLIGIMNFVYLFGFQLEVLPGVIFQPVGQVMIPTLLVLILVVYIVEGTQMARVALIGIIGVNVLALLSLSFLMIYQQFNVPTVGGTITTGRILDPSFLRGVTASIITLILDMYLLVIVYQGLHNIFHSLPDWFKAMFALLIALWTDAIVFNLGYHFGTPAYVARLPGDLIAKTLSAFALLPVIIYYLEQIAPRLPQYKGAGSRPTFDVVHGIAGRLQDSLQTLQSELNVSRRTYARLTENIGEIFWLANVHDDHVGDVVYVSDAFRKITGYLPQQVYNGECQFSDLVHLDDKLLMPDGFMEYVIGALEREFRIKTADDNTRWIRSRSFPIYNNAGEIEQYAGVMEDITEKKEIREKEFELALAEEKMRLLHDFIRDASHDLKTPLSAIILKADLAHRTTVPTHRQLLLGQLKERALYLSDMIDDLFTLSRIEGQESATDEWINLHDLVQAAVTTARPLAADKALTLVLELAEGEAMQLHGNADQLLRVINNLISNAIRYTHEGRITIHTRKLQDMLLLSVEDTGIGISEDELPLIFNRFYRTHHAIQTDASGTGLGLSICQAIIDQHNGIMTVESEKGIGSKFTIALPTAPAAAEASAYTASGSDNSKIPDQSSER